MIYNQQLIHLVHIARRSQNIQLDLGHMKLGLNSSLLGAPSWFKIKEQEGIIFTHLYLASEANKTL